MLIFAMDRQHVRREVLELTVPLSSVVFPRPPKPPSAESGADASWPAVSLLLRTSMNGSRFND